MLEFEQVTTRGGDRGDSSLYNGERRGKDENVFEALGDVDELSSALGLARALLREKNFDSASADLEKIQELLIIMGGEIATPRSSPGYGRIRRIGETDILALEKMEHALLKRTNIEPRFILPGESVPSAAIDLARSVCRRAERSVVRCIRRDSAVHLVKVQNYLNRLSDYLFILGRSTEQKKRRDP